MTEPEPIEVTVHIAARPETVFAYFTDPARYTQWMGTRATLQPVPGGTYHVFMRDGVESAGEFVEIDPPHRLCSPGAGPTTLPLHLEAPVSWSRSNRRTAVLASCCLTTICQTTSGARTTARA